MRLKYQIFVTLMLFSIVLIVLNTVINNWSFDRGFSNFVIANAKERLSVTVDNLQNAYIDQGNWNWIESQPNLFRELTQQNWPPVPRQNRGRGNSRLGRQNAEGQRNSPRRQNVARSARNLGLSRLVLLDAEKKFLSGRAIDANSVIFIPIVVDEQNVGYLGFPEPRGIPGGLADVFSSQQMRNAAYSAAAMVLLSIVLAIALASRIVRPILSVKKAVQTISGGDYTYQIKSQRTDEIGDLENNINRLSLTLKNNKEARQQWMAEISHELRTPVSVLQGELEGMQDGLVPIDRKAVDSLHSESVRLGLLINDLYDLSLSDVGALNYRMQAVDLGDVLQQRLQVSSALTTQASLSVRIYSPEEAVRIDGDPKRLAQLFDNLLQNSVRYTDVDGKIVIRLTLETSTCVLDWADSSPGVDPDQIPQLFDALYRTEDSRSRDTGGSGLGLAIVKKIVEAHGGTVEAYQSDMNGLGIKIRFPLNSRDL